MQLPRALTIPPQTLAVVAVAFLVASCQPGSTGRPVPSVAQIGADLKCGAGDHGYEDLQAGWGFCYPESWKFAVRAQSTITPPELDLTFDITYAPCSTPPPAASGATAEPQCSPGAGTFAYMIVSTYDRSNATNLATWVQSNLPKTDALGDNITWGNAVEAAKLSDGRRIALTPHQVVILDLHSGLLDLEADMSPRLGTWKFSY